MENAFPKLTQDQAKEKFAALLKRIKADAGWSVSELAQKMGLAPGWLTNILSGRDTPSQELLKRKKLVEKFSTLCPRTWARHRAEYERIVPFLPLRGGYTPKGPKSNDQPGAILWQILGAGRRRDAESAALLGLSLHAYRARIHGRVPIRKAEVEGKGWPMILAQAEEENWELLGGLFIKIVTEQEQEDNKMQRGHPQNPAHQEPKSQKDSQREDEAIKLDRQTETASGAEGSPDAASLSQQRGEERRAGSGEALEDPRWVVNNWPRAAALFLRTEREREGDSVEMLVKNFYDEELADQSVWERLESGAPEMTETHYLRAVHEVCRAYLVDLDSLLTPRARRAKLLLALAPSATGRRADY